MPRCRTELGGSKEGYMQTVLVAVVILIITAFAANADPEECREAIRNYNSARAEVSDALRRYAD